MESYSSASSTNNNNVWLFYPNLIGYGRIVLAIMAMYYMSSSPVCAMFCYALSAGLDAFDGWAARTYNQSSRFGAMLDQLTDRCALLTIVMALCRLYPDHLFVLQLSAVIDIASHWLHLHATDLSGASSHKQSSNWLLNLYYTDRLFLGFMCGGNEAFYILLYIRAFWAGPLLFGAFHFMSIFPLIAFPIAFVKSAISVVHLYTAAEMVVAHDVKLRVDAAQKKQ
uniref:CDP-diacylglycerol--inositol 3-phosphatidyltransferase n=1 Tax=Caenorhabditis tropicalis TaxID=1561998 RepID=A0A1I7TEB1_9PELO